MTEEIYPFTLVETLKEQVVIMLPGHAHLINSAPALPVSVLEVTRWDEADWDFQIVSCGRVADN